MKVVKIRPQQKEIKCILNTDTGDKIELYKWGNSAVCVNPPVGLNKESKVYLAIKKAFMQSDYCNEDLHLKNRQLNHISELKQRLKMFIGKEL